MLFYRQPCYPAPVPLPTHCERGIELDPRWSDDTLLWNISGVIGDNVVPYPDEVASQDFRWNTVVLTVTGHHSFKEILCLENGLGPRLSAKRLLARYREHCTYHATLDRMVRERMEKDRGESGPA